MAKKPAGGWAKHNRQVKKDLVSKYGAEKGSQIYKAGGESKAASIIAPTTPPPADTYANDSSVFDMINRKQQEVRGKSATTLATTSAAWKKSGDTGLHAGGWMSPPPPPPPQANDIFGNAGTKTKTLVPTENVINKPFMAMDVDKNGQPIYGVGLKGWARKAVADMTDPAKYFQDIYRISEQEQNRITAEFESNKAAGGRTVEALTKWSQWGQKITGITAEEVGAMGALGKAERDIAKAQAKKQGTSESVILAGTAAARMARMSLDTTQNFVWGGLAILGMGDQAMRKIHGTVQGLDAVADQFSKDETTNIVSKLYSGNPLAVGKDVYTVAKAISDKKITWSDTKEIINKYQAGSEMAYSNMFDEAARADFEKGIAEGKDPITLAQNLGNIGIELLGSIAGDPTTYLGISLVKPVNIWSKAAKSGQVLSNEVKLFGISARVPWKTVAVIPTFGELIGANVGHARLASQADRYTHPAIEGLADLMTKASKSKTSQYLNQATDLIMARYATPAVNAVSNMAISKKMKWWNLAAPDTAGKVNIVSRDVSLFLQSLIGNNALDESLAITRDMARMRSADPAVARTAVQKLIGKGQREMVFSEVGEMTGELLARLGEENIGALLQKHGGDAMGLHNELMGKLHSVVNEFIPSVDEMADASRQAKELRKAGQEVSEKLAHFEKMYDKDVPRVVKMVNVATKPLVWTSNVTSRAMVFTFMHLVPRSISKNIQGAFIPMAMRIGFMEALDASLTAFAGLNKNKTADILFNTNSAIDQLVGFVPAYNGIAKMVGENAEGIWKMPGFLPALKRSEEIMAQKIILQTIKNEIQNGLPAVVKNLPEWDNLIKALPENQRALPFTALVRTNGNFDEAMKMVRKWVGNGEIEAWRLADPPPALKNYLDDNNLLDAFRVAQENATDDIQFKKVIDDITTQFKNHVKDQASQLPWTNTKMPEQLNDWGMDMAKHLPEEQTKIINGVILSWRNTQDALSGARNSVVSTAERMAQQAALMGDNAPFEKLQQIKQKLQTLDPIMSKTYQEMDAVRGQVAEQMIRKVTPENIPQLWNTKIRVGGKDKFSLKDIYPNVDIAGMSVTDFERFAWPAMIENTSATFRNANLAVYENTLEEMNNIAGIFGKSLDDIAGNAKAGDSVINVLLKARNNAIEIEEAYAWERFFRQQEFAKDKTIRLVDAVKQYQKDFPDWMGDVNKIVAEVNDTNTAKTNISIIAKKYGFGTVTEKGVPLDKKLLNIINDYARGLGEGIDTNVGKVGDDERIAAQEAANFLSREFTNLEDVPQSLAEQAFKNSPHAKPVVEAAPVVDTGWKTAEELTLDDALKGIRARKVVPPYDGRVPNEARTLYEGIGDAEADIAKWSETVISEWGKKVKTLPTDVTDAVKAAKAAIKPRMDTLKLQAAVTGVSTRNFVLHDYNKTGLDHALTYALGNSFHYWTTRTYMRSMESLVENPKYANAYMAYKEFNTKRHSDQPDWYRQNLQFDSLMGIPLKNPLFVNFEQAVNPMYGLVGTDFDDPRKNVDWVTRMVNDMNKMGPTFSPLVSWAVALHCYNIGEEEAGQRFAGRMLPQTQIIKSASSALLGKPIELDPFVLALDKGVDPYEENRVVASMAMMVRNKEVINGQVVTQEMMDEATYTVQNGRQSDLWDAGIEASATARFGGDATSFFLGAGIRPRTKNDMVIEKFWKDYSVMVSSRSMMDAEEYRESWDAMRDNPEYGMFMDSLLLCRKSGDEMDTAYTYNVLGRLPPGQLNDALEVAGIDPEVVSAFYDNKGDWDKMDLQPQERQILMGQIVNIASVYKMPSNANRKDYNIAKKQYAEMNVALTAKYGESILIKMNEYWNDPNQSDYLEKNPDVAEAMEYKDQIVVNNPKLMQYYGGMFTLERYYVADAENQLEQKYGRGIADKVKQYNNLLTTEEKSAFLKANSKLKTYQAEYADADLIAAKKLEAKWGNMEYALQEYKSEKALRDPEYKKEIATKYKISAYNKELNKLTKAEREAINKKYGEEMVMDARSYSIADAERKDELEKKYSPLQAYMNDRAAFMKLLPDRLVELGTKIPDTPAAELRPDQPNPANKTQRELQQLAQPRLDAQQWTQALGEPMMELIQDYDNGAKLPQQIRTKLERDADKFGFMTGDEMLQAILISLQ